MLSKKDFNSRLISLKQPLINYCRHQLWDKSQLEDAIQSTLLIAIQKSSEFNEDSNFRAWIFKICTQVILNINSKLARERRHISDSYDQVADVVAELQREYAYEELLENPNRVLNHVGDDLRGAVLKLSESERTIFLLKSIGDLRCREIAETLSLPLGTVMAYLSRARGKLREHLSEYARQYGFLSSEIREESKDEL